MTKFEVGKYYSENDGISTFVKIISRANNRMRIELTAPYERIKSMPLIAYVNSGQPSINNGADEFFYTDGTNDENDPSDFLFLFTSKEGFSSEDEIYEEPLRTIYELSDRELASMLASSDSFCLD